MALTVGNLQFDIAGITNVVKGTLGFDASYPTDGEPLTPANIGLRVIDSMRIDPKSGYTFNFNYTDNKVLVYRSAGFTPAGSVAAPTFSGESYTPTGTVAAPTFTGTSPITDLNYATPAFTGTGLTAAGQVLTTTDNQTMTLNQCAGMWLLPATGTTPPMLIVSNTSVTAAPAVLTVIGAAATDAGAYKILKALTPIGTNSAPGFTGGAHTLAGTNSAPGFTGTAVAAGVLVEVSNATDLSALTGVRFRAEGA